VMLVGPFVIVWEELSPKKDGKEKMYSGQEGGVLA